MERCLKPRAACHGTGNAKNGPAADGLRGNGADSGSAQPRRDSRSSAWWKPRLHAEHAGEDASRSRITCRCQGRPTADAASTRKSQGKWYRSLCKGAIPLLFRFDEFATFVRIDISRDSSITASDHDRDRWHWRAGRVDSRARPSQGAGRRSWSALSPPRTRKPPPRGLRQQRHSERGPMVELDGTSCKHTAARSSQGQECSLQPRRARAHPRRTSDVDDQLAGWSWRLLRTAPPQVCDREVLGSQGAKEHR